MKLITFVVPCYNSQDYMHRCIESLLKAGQETQIVVVNDGSTDDTGKIANTYEMNYPDIVKVIHKKNGGHGSGVNAGLKIAEGKYFKVVDSDDWLDESALKHVMGKLHFWENHKDEIDLVVCNYIYDHLNEGKKRVMNYQNVFPENEVIGWKQMGRFRPSQYLIMHSLLFRTEVLRKSNVVLPEHTFYVDNIFANQPLSFVKSIVYLNENLYHYFLGREDQSVNEKVLMERIDQQIFVTKTLLEKSNISGDIQLPEKLEHYLLRNISIMMAISDIHLVLIGDKDAMKKRKELWDYVKQYNEQIYWNLRLKRLSAFTYLPGRLGTKLTLRGYQIAKKAYLFN